MTHSTSKDSAHAVASIQELDLDPLKIKLMDLDEGHGWSRAKTDQVEIEYRRFLTLLAKYPDETVAPNRDVDKFWHAHILDTLKYAEDCELVFGYFVHHFPYFGMRGDDDAANLARAAATTARLYESEFGESASGVSSYCGKAADVAYCGKFTATAYCGKADTVSYCGKAQSVSYCGKAAGTAYCGRMAIDQLSSAALARENIMNTSLRPSLTH